MKNINKCQLTVKSPKQHEVRYVLAAKPYNEYSIMIASYINPR